jgi:integrase
MQRKLTKGFIATATAEPNAERTLFWDKDLPGFGLMVTANGHRSFVVQYRFGRRSRRLTIDGRLSLPDARRRAKSYLGDIARDRDPLEERRKVEAAAEGTLKSVAEEYLKREGKNLRSIKQRRAIFERILYPDLGARQIGKIGRSEIVRLLDRVEDQRGPVMADMVLAALRRLMSWHAGRTDEFRSPIVRGMARTKPRERARERILSDDELRAIWTAAQQSDGPLGYLVRFWLLTATRRNEAARMTREEVEGSGWTIPAERHKSKRDFLLPLSEDAEAILAAVPVIGRSGYIFSTDGTAPVSGFSKWKKKFDTSCGIKGWRIHDLRRTARSLMSRAGIDSDIAERCLGHVIGGVRGTYDRYEYREEKAHAFEALAAQVMRVIKPVENSPVDMGPVARQAGPA